MSSEAETALSGVLAEQLKALQADNTLLRASLEEARVAAAHKDRLSYDNAKLRAELDHAKGQLEEKAEQEGADKLKRADLEGQVLALNREASPPPCCWLHSPPRRRFPG